MESQGFWTSSIGVEDVVAGAGSLQEMRLDGDVLYWTETRPGEQGRVALVRYGKGGQVRDLFPDKSVRSRVHEYGGGSFEVKDGVIAFTSDKDRMVYLARASGPVEALCHDPLKRYANFCLGGHFVFCLCEDHSNESAVTNSIVCIDIASKQNKIIAQGSDFYSSPSLSPDGKKLAFISWDFPHMPWEESSLHVGEIGSDGSLHKVEKIAGGKSESICQLKWSQEGNLYFVYDKTGYWNLHRYKEGKVDPLFLMQADFGLPEWIIGTSTYSFISRKDKELLVCIYSERGIDHLALLDPDNHTLEHLDTPFTVIKDICAVDEEHVYFFGGSPKQLLSVISLNLTTKKYDVIKESVCPLPTEDISLPEELVIPTREGECFAFYYPSKNRLFSADRKNLSPLIVKCHSGPTAHASPLLSMEVQFWTSRGFAWLDVNYRGSTGYGRAYREKLSSKWGEIDVQDCVAAAAHMIETKQVDPAKIFVKGSSAGGFTALLCLSHSSLFAGGVSSYGVTDLTLLAGDTHKFEKHYLDSLLGPYPQEKTLYEARSPMSQVGGISSPILLLQGEEDPVVPLSQVEIYYQRLKSCGKEVRLVLFPGEGHGFKKADTIKRALQEELSFYQNRIRGK